MTLYDEAAAVAWRGIRAFGVRVDRAFGNGTGRQQARAGAELAGLSLLLLPFTFLAALYPFLAFLALSLFGLGRVAWSGGADRLGGVA